MRLQNKSYPNVGDEKSVGTRLPFTIKVWYKKMYTYVFLCKNYLQIHFNNKIQIIFLENSFRNNEHAFLGSLVLVHIWNAK